MRHSYKSRCTFGSTIRGDGFSCSVCNGTASRKSTSKSDIRIVASDSESRFEMSAARPRVARFLYGDGEDANVRCCGFGVLPSSGELPRPSTSSSFSWSLDVSLAPVTDEDSLESIDMRVNILCRDGRGKACRKDVSVCALVEEE